MRQICAVILAAGMSSRMGEAKQLVSLHGRYLLEHVIRLALQEGFAQVLTVIGHEADRIQRSIQIEDTRLRWVINPMYRLGQSTSFTLGIRKALEAHSSAMVFLGDQPFVKSQTVHEVWSHGNQRMQDVQQPFVLQPAYREKPGHPVFFGNVNSALFENLAGDQGAKSIIATMHRRILLPVDDPGIHFDIDTQADLEKAQHSIGTSEEYACICNIHYGGEGL